jgi:hypothetical protein
VGGARGGGAVSGDAVTKTMGGVAPSRDRATLSYSLHFSVLLCYVLKQCEFPKYLSRS